MESALSRANFDLPSRCAKTSDVTKIRTVLIKMITESLEPSISFHEKTHDILLNGSQRNANGKGVRALLTAAFKIGVMDVCRENGVPHPGIITLDSPLLSYRDPLKSKHPEELSEEEKTVVAAGLKIHFYDYLIKRSDEVQFIVMENQDPPYELPDSVREYVFTGEHASEGRKGLF